MFEMRYAAQLYNVYFAIYKCGCVCANANVFIVLERPDRVRVWVFSNKTMSIISKKLGSVKIEILRQATDKISNILYPKNQ